MQKTRGASILIWSLFLSFFIAFTFVSFSISVNKTIQNAYGVGKILDTLLSFNLYFSNTSFVSTPLNAQEQLLKDNSNSFGLEDGKATEIRFDGASTAKITITIEKGGPLSYSFVSFNSSTMSSTLTANGILTTSASFYGVVQGGDDAAILYIKNLGGQAQFKYASSVNSMNPKSTYKVMIKIGEEYFQKSIFERRNFTVGDYPGFNYTKYEMLF